MPFDEQTEQTLRELFESIEVVDTPPEGESEPYLFSAGAETGGLLFRGDSLSMLRRLSHDLARSALSSGGTRPNEVERLVIGYCHTGVREGPDVAVRALEEQLDAVPVTRTVVFECTVHVKHGRNLDIAGGRLSQSVPEGLRDHPSPPTPPLFVVDVAASDDESARIVAADRFEEAMAILALTDQPPHDYAIPATHMLHPGGSTSYHSSPGRAIVVRTVNPPEPEGYTPLWQEYQALADAAAVPKERREDWVGRCLRAARWLRTAENAIWPSLALSASMSAMECILVRSIAESAKGATISGRLFELGLRLHGHSEESQYEWFVGQYRSRNAAVHEGMSPIEELEVETVVSVARHSTAWAVSHLRRFHGVPDNSVCTTFEEVFDAVRHPRYGDS